MFFADGLTGLKDAISAFPKAEIQGRIIHQLRKSFKYISYKDIKSFSKDFKAVYTVTSEDAALESLCELQDKWGRQYHYALKSWESN